MNKDYALLAVEDVLSEAVGRRMLSEISMAVSQPIGLKGSGYLKRKARDLNRTARGFPVVMITDLDNSSSCAPSLIDEWLRVPAEKAFMFRVAVLEVESWVMADKRAISRFLGISVSSIPHQVDEIENPKEMLVSLARASSSGSIRDDLVPPHGSTAKVGPAYNTRLVEFVRDVWDPRRAADVSPSLARALRALTVFRSDG